MTAMPSVKKPISEQDKKLLTWTAERVRQCQTESFYGKMTVHFENGKVVRTVTERSEVPKV
jgi:hypothetical protein